MEWIHGVKVNDARALRALRVSPHAVALSLEAAFAEMTFVHGFAHADPHPGNIMVRPAREWGGLAGGGGWQLRLRAHAARPATWSAAWRA